MRAADELGDLINGAITTHRFDPWLRDYRVEAERWADSEDGAPYTYRFTHCVFVEVASLMPAETWLDSWTTPTDLAAWEEAESRGFAWGVGWAEVQNASLVSGSERARAWSRHVGHEMHEVVIETQVFRLTLVYHALVVSPRD
jgi:hypothetical protein